MKTHKFARKPFYVDAVRVSEANIEEVAAWCEGEIQTTDDGQKYVSVKVHRPLTDRQTQAFIGDWVLFAGSGFKVYTPKAFDKSFEKVKTLTKAQADEAGIKVPHEKSQKPKRKHPVPTPPRNPVLSREVAEKLKATEQGETADGNVSFPVTPAPDTTLPPVAREMDGKEARGPEAKNDPTTYEDDGVSLDPADVEAQKLINEVLRQK